MGCYAHLTEDERDQIGILRAAGHSLGAIAKALGRAKCTVSREVRRNALPSGRYSPLHAAGAYMSRRQREAVLETDLPLQAFVRHRLAEGWSPEQIAGWLKAGRERRLRAIGCETIYAFIYRAGQKAQALWRYLTRHHKRRRPRRARPSRDTIRNRTSIHNLPDTIATRKEVGHWEGDGQVQSMPAKGRRKTYPRPARDGYIDPIVTVELAPQLNSCDARTMARQHIRPLLISSDGQAISLAPLSLEGGEGSVLEDSIQALVHAHPTILPIREIDPQFADPIPICRELMTPAGPIDNFMITPTGLRVLVECKLWRNAEARREVVGQILDYAKELAQFRVSDLQREASRRLGSGPTALFDCIRVAAPDVDEVEFYDALSANLRRGRFLLLIVGDGIRERVESISEYLQAHAGLHFSFGLIEMPIFAIPGGGRLVSPRVLAHTTIITRTVVALPDGYALQEVVSSSVQSDVDPETVALGDARQNFWFEFLQQLRLDDPEQPVPRPPRQGYMSFSLPAPSGSSWLLVYRDMKSNEVGVFLSSNRDSAGDRAMRAIAEEWETIGPLLGGTAERSIGKDGRPRIGDAFRPGSLDQVGPRAQAFAWLAERTNTFINVLRPRVRSVVADFKTSDQD